MHRHVLLLLLATFPFVLSDDGYQADWSTTCRDVSVGPLSGELCASGAINSCNQTVSFNVTFSGDAIVPTTTVTSTDTFRQCVRLAGVCDLCIEVDGFDVDPAGATVCPTGEIDCGVFDGEYNVCVDLGSSCAGASCSSCLGDANCGWCASEGKCHPAGPDGPHCTTCGNVSDDWWTDSAKCPKEPFSPLPTDESSFFDDSTKAGLAIGIPVAVLAVILLIAIFYCVKRRRSPSSPSHVPMGSFHGPSSVTTHHFGSEDDDDDTGLDTHMALDDAETTSGVVVQVDSKPAGTVAMGLAAAGEMDDLAYHPPNNDTKTKTGSDEGKKE